MTNTPPLVIYHAGCADGFCAAWVAHQKMPSAEFLPMNHGDRLPNITGRDVFVLDFSFKRDVMDRLIEQCGSLVVLDHHKTAENELAPFIDRPSAKRIHIHFDMNKSGGRLAWEFFRLFGDQPPWLVDYTEDRDLWRWKLNSSREINAALRSYPFDFNVWGHLARRFHLDLVSEGAAILRYQAQVVDAAVSYAVEIKMAGHKVLSTNATTLISEIGEKLAKDRPFSAIYFFRADGRKVWSLRSSKDGGVDVSEIAESFGGGGHRNAAVFEE